VELGSRADREASAHGEEPSLEKGKTQDMSALRTAGAVVLSVFILAFIGLLIYAAHKDAATATVPTPLSPPLNLAKLRLTVQETSYVNGDLKVVGVVENIGQEAIFNPTIEVQIYDTGGKTLLAEEQTWPSDQRWQNMEPGQSATFHCVAHVPSAPSKVRWVLSVPDAPFEIVE